MSEYQGNLISVEGIDGVGTTTLCEGLREELGDEFEFTQEPSSGKYGRILREELASDSDPTLSELYLFLADRYDHSRSLIEPKLDEGENIITDRYHLSTMAYQSEQLQEFTKMPYHYIDSAVGPWLVEPDLVLYVDAPVNHIIDRVGGEKYEKEEFLKNVRLNYKALTGFYDIYDTGEVVRIDGKQSEEKVLERALEEIESL